MNIPKWMMIVNNNEYSKQRKDEEKAIQEDESLKDCKKMISVVCFLQQKQQRFGEEKYTKIDIYREGEPSGRSYLGDKGFCQLSQQ